MTRLAYLGVVLLAWCALSRAAIADPRVQIAREQTFVVQSALGDGKGTIGAGVLVASNDGILTIATAAHAITNVDALRILDTSRRDYYTVVDVHALPAYDLAFIRVRAQPGFSVAPVALAAPQAGELVWIWGNHDGGFWNVARGSVLNTEVHLPGEDGSARFTIACALCAPGDSGSGVFDAAGHLLGILTKGWVAHDGTVRFIEVESATLIAQEVGAQPLMAAAPEP